MFAGRVLEASLKNSKVGYRAEWLARIYLNLKGFRILAHRYRTAVGEVDLIAKRGKLIVAVEVKCRQKLLTAAEAISLRQRRRIERCLLCFLAHNPYLNWHTLRFDVMLIAPNQWPVHITNAWLRE